MKMELKAGEDFFALKKPQQYFLKNCQKEEKN